KEYQYARGRLTVVNHFAAHQMRIADALSAAPGRREQCRQKQESQGPIHNHSSVEIIFRSDSRIRGLTFPARLEMSIVGRRDVVARSGEEFDEVTDVHARGNEVHGAV